VIKGLAAKEGHQWHECIDVLKRSGQAAPTGSALNAIVMAASNRFLSDLMAGRISSLQSWRLAV
jgi:hypothetical protein